MYTSLHALHAKQWLEKLRLVDPPIHDANARVCDQHFNDNDFVSPVMEGYGPSRCTLKPDAVPTVFCFTSAPKRRKLSKAREAKAQHCVIVDELLAPAEDTRPLTRDVGVQCSKL